MPSTPRFVVAAPQNGSCKSLVASGLMAAFAHGSHGQGFMVGPDTIDPMGHSAATGRPSRNLDTWMLPAPAVRAGFVEATVRVDLANLEGGMGPFDGHDASPLTDSTAEVTLLVQAPIVLGVDGGACQSEAS